MGKIWCGGAVSKARTNCKNIVSFQTHIIFFSCYYQQYNTKTKLEKGYSTSSYTEYTRICITQGTESSYFFSFLFLSLVFPALLNVELSLREVGFSSRDEQKANWCSNDSSHCPSEGGTDLKSGWRRLGALNQLDFFPAASEHHPFVHVVLLVGMLESIFRMSWAQTHLSSSYRLQISTLHHAEKERSQGAPRRQNSLCSAGVQEPKCHLPESRYHWL